MATPSDGKGTDEDMFKIIKTSTNALGPRRARLALPGRRSIETPHYLGLTSRGVIPHVSQDNFDSLMDVSGVYIALEDFIERAPQKIPPILKFAQQRPVDPLRRFVALPDETLLVVGARRTPPLAAPAANSNTNTSVAISTAIGFKTLKAEAYAEDVELLKPDVVIGLGDIPYERALSSKRIEKAVDRQIQWLKDHVTSRQQVKAEDGTSSKLFAPLLPVSCANQQYYIECLTGEVRDDIHGLAVYDLESLQDLPGSLSDLPQIGFTDPKTPHDILRNVALGMDVHAVPFLTTASEAGIALDFSLSREDGNSHILPLGIDMWSPDHATELGPLVKGCTCYACTDHHRAYLQHLLNAKEMLAWVLLQVHNHAVMDRFFGAVRQSVDRGTFDADAEAFARAYEPQLPAQTGTGPRLRGYQYKSDHAAETKKNRKAYDAFTKVDTPDTVGTPDEAEVAALTGSTTPAKVK
ncbi:hypothetical protein LTR95_009235 [Oleoguttula sp. CCFEE 5521]